MLYLKKIKINKTDIYDYLFYIITQFIICNILYKFYENWIQVPYCKGFWQTTKKNNYIGFRNHLGILLKTLQMYCNQIKIKQ